MATSSFSPLTTLQAQWLAAACRQALQEALAGRKPAQSVPPAGQDGLQGKYGVFVSWHGTDEGELRGCIGFTTSDQALWRSTPEAAVYAALGDKRFESVKPEEYAQLRLEISVLGPLRPIDALEPAARISAVRVGRDGLVLQYGPKSGILLPQVAVEWNWKSAEFLDALCQKAGLPSGMWKSASAKLYTFQAQIWSEPAPGQPVREIKLMV